ncbi:MAG: hypothetical protein VX642_00205, partial [Bdellovibrionota bacterium]|nr:hypothetical protein [Bdellovibrionota bacterium]
KSGTSNIEALKQDPEMHELLKNSSTIEAVVSYLERQEWYYDRWEDIPKDVRSQKYTYVIRNIGVSNFKFMGLITEMHQAKDLAFAKEAVLSAVSEIRRADAERDFPRASNIKGYSLSKIIARSILRRASHADQAGEDKIETRSEYAKRKEFRSGMFKLVDGVYIPYYQTRGLEPEQERIFNDSFLHTYGEHPQKFKSTSVDPFYEWLLNNSGDLKFMPGGVSVLYKLEIGTEAVDAKFSVYTAQAEVLDNSRYGGVPRWTTWSGWKLLFRTIGTYSEENLRLIPRDIELKEIEKDPELTPEEKATAIASFNKRQDLGKRAKKFLENLEFEDGNNYGVLPPDTLLYNAKYELQKREKEDSQ